MNNTINAVREVMKLWVCLMVSIARNNNNKTPPCPQVAAVERATGEGTGGIEGTSREDRVGAVVCEFSAILEAADAIVVKGAQYMEGGDAGECMEVVDVEGGPTVHFALEDGENARGNAEGMTSGEAAAVDISGELDSNGTAEARPLNADAGDICEAMQGEVDEGYISDGDNPRDTREHVQETASGEAAAVDTFSELESNGIVEARSRSADADDVCEAMQGVVDEVSEAGETIVVTVATAKNIDGVAFRKTGIGGGEGESTMVEDEDKDAVEVVVEVRRGSDPSLGERGESSEEILEADVGIEIQSDSAREPAECREAESSGWLENHDDVHCVPCATDDAATAIPAEDDGGSQTREESVDSEAEAVSSVAAVQQEVDDMELGEAGVAGEGFADSEGREEEDVEKRGGQMEAEGKVQNSQQVVVFVSADEGGVVALEMKIKTERRDVPEIEQDGARRAEGAAAKFGQQEEVDEEQGQGRDKATEKVEARMGKDLQVVDVEGEKCTVGEGDTRQPRAHSAFLPATGNGEAEPAADTINVQGVDDAFPAAQTEHLPASEEAAQCANGTDANGDFVLQPSGDCDCVVDWEALAREIEEEWVFDGSPDEAAVVLPDVAAIDPETQREIEAGVSQHVALKTAVIDINASDFDIDTAATGLKETKQHVEDIEDDKPAPSTGAGDDAAAADSPPVAAAGARPAESTGGNPDPKSSEVPKDCGSLRSGRALVGASSRISTSGQEVHSGFAMSPIRSNSHPLVVEGVNADGAAASGVDARGRGAGAPFVPGSVSPVQRGASIRLERSSATPLGGRDNTRPVQGGTRGGDGAERSQSMDQERESQNLGENAESACECCILM